jgi:hypothetical protein
MDELSPDSQGEERCAAAHGALRAISQPMVAIVEEVSGLNVRAYEGRLADELIAELRPIAAALVDRALATIDDVVDRCMAAPFGTSAEARPAEEGGATASPREGAADERFELTLDSLVDQRSSPLQAIDDIAFLARLELRQRRGRLAALAPDRSQMDILAECERSLRGVRKSLAALDQAVADAWNAPRSLDYRSELDTSLRVRRCYARLRREMLEGGEPRPEALTARLRAAGTLIAILVGREIYPELRIRDRLQLRELQGRILGWLREGFDDIAGGVRLFQDLAAFVRMLAEVNHRQELVAHDAGVVARVHARLEQAASSTSPDELREELEPLRGLDDELDTLLEASCRDRAAYEPIVDRLHARLATRHHKP